MTEQNERKWTPGPWAYRPLEYDDWGYVRGPIDADGFHNFICQAKDMRVTEVDESIARQSGADPWSANAHLIAAAPELYEALEWALSEIDGRTRYDSDDQRGNCLDLAHTALAKARGEA